MFSFRNTFPPVRKSQDLSAQALVPRLGRFSARTHALGSKGERGTLLASSALGRNARPARFRPGLVEERQGWDESFFFWPFLFRATELTYRASKTLGARRACVGPECTLPRQARAYSWMFCRCNGRC